MVDCECSGRYYGLATITMSTSLSAALQVEVEAKFLDGTRLITVCNPIAALDGDMTLALKGSFLPEPELTLFGDMPEDVPEDRR